MANRRGNLHEDGFNYGLAEAIRESNQAWADDNQVQEERVDTGSRIRIDVLIKSKDLPPVAIECAYDGDGGEDAIKRLDYQDSEFKTAISINVPDIFRTSHIGAKAVTKALRDGSTIKYAAFQKKLNNQSGEHRRFPKNGYITGTVHDLVSFIHAAAAPKEYVEDAAEKVVKLIRNAGESLKALPPKTIKDISDLMSQRTELNGVHATAIMWLDAMLVQNMISKDAGMGIKPLPLPDEVVPIEIRKEWRKILEINWKSIFEPAVEALEIVCRGYDSCTTESLKNLLEAVGELTRRNLSSQINVGAELFPKISDDRSEAAAFYTLPSTAELLATLTIRASDRKKSQWKDGGIFKEIKIADFACGTGSLLRSAVKQVSRLHQVSGGNDLDSIYKAAIEEGLVGTDVSPIASHLTLSSLILTGSGKRHTKTNIGFLEVGGNYGKTGALEFLASNPEMDNMFFKKSDNAHTGVSDSESAVANYQDTRIVAKDSDFDYILMNPPYSRTRGGQSAFDIAGLSEKERDLCQKQWGKLNKGLPTSNQAGMAASFLCLALKKIKSGGRMGFVLPLTAAFSESWGMTRAMLLSEFEDIIALTAPQQGHDSNMSADTGMGEMLLICKKRKHSRKEMRTSVLCGTLENMPIHCGEACEYGRSILSAAEGLSEASASHHRIIKAGDAHEIGRIILFTPPQPDAPWSHLGVRNVHLASTAHLLTQGVVNSIRTGKRAENEIPMVTMRELFYIGPTHDLIGHLRDKDARGALVLDPITGSGDSIGENQSLWAAAAEKQTKLMVSPTHKGTIHNRLKRQNLEDKQGTLHYARGLRWTSQKLAAATTSYPVFGGRAWTTLLDDDKNLKHAFSLWANSTYGALVHWTQGSRTQLGRAVMQVKAIKSVPVPNLRKLSKSKINAAASFWNEATDKDLLPLCQLHADKNRHEIDKAVASMLDIPYSEDEMNAIRRAFCEEPSVHGNNKKALEMLG